MPKYINLLMGSALCLLTACQGKTTLEDLRQQITEQLSKEKGVFAVAYKNLQTGEALLIRADEKFHAASTMKTPVMIEVYKQAAEGKFALTDSVVITNEFKSIVDSSTFSLDTAEDSEKELY